MNEITPYEQLIAAKLDQVPVPDMADSIWSNIDMQLDMPAEVPDGSTAAPASTFKGPGWYGLAGIVAVAALLLWYFSHKGPTKGGPPPKGLPEKYTPLPVEPPPAEDSHASGKSDKKKSIPITPVGIKKDTVSFHSVPKDSIRVDSAAKQVLPPAKADSSFLQRRNTALPDVDLYEAPRTTAPGKKHRGVKGITDDDYKISAGKDSGKKRY